MVSPVGGAT